MTRRCVDGNEAAARVAYACSETVAIYPITPASPMGEAADAWAAAGRPNLWGAVPRVVQLQSEGGAAGALHGAVTEGSLATTFTASQGLLLMLPNMFKIAGELSPAVIHVAARTIATHALSIFGDHSDVMAARTTGWAMLFSGSVQEAQDLAAVSHAATLASRVPFLHAFDGFRTSHELNRIDVLGEDVLHGLLDEDAIAEHRSRGLDPHRPTLRGTAQNPDVFFQAREASNRYHLAVPRIVAATMERFAQLTGRRYGLVDYHGAADADRVIVLMGSGVGAVRETVDALVADGARVGVLQVRLFRPFPVDAFLEALPRTVEHVAVLDRTKEPGAPGEPLYADVVAALDQGLRRGLRAALPVVQGGRYGLSSKEFTPRMVAGIFDHLATGPYRHGFTVGIVDDVTGTSLPVDEHFAVPRPAGTVQAVLWGLGSDGTVGAGKSTVKIVGEHTDLHAQGYAVYDSKKSGAVTVSHLRFAPGPIASTYLIGEDEADVVACHQFGLLGDRDVLAAAKPGGVFLLNAPFPAEVVWDRLPLEVQETILAKRLRLFVVDAYTVAREAGLGGLINTVMQPCFFAVAGILSPDRAVAAIEEAVRRTYRKRGIEVVERNLTAVGRSLDALREVVVPAAVTATSRRRAGVPAAAPDFVQRVTARIMAGQGDLLPVSALPVDGTFPTATARWEKRAIALDIPVWDPAICIDCGKCAIVCPHAAIRMKAYDAEDLADAPAGFPAKEFRSKELPGKRLTVQVSPDDCTGCGVCVDVCPARAKEAVGHKALDLLPVGDHADRERERFAFFDTIAPVARDAVPHDDVKHTQLLEPLFEYSGACAGCGETPYLKLLTQLFGDRMVVANATGCSSIYGGNLPTTPWSVDRDGCGPAWSNSLFEDNAEFGLGMRIAHEQHAATARAIAGELAGPIGAELVEAILHADQRDEEGIAAQRVRIAALRERLAALGEPHAASARRLSGLADDLVRQSFWIIGGDGWAYDIGYGGLDHLLASGLDVNVLVLDTEVYSNTGGQASKATPRGAVAKFAQSGKGTPKKDLGLLAMQYGDVYVAQIALGANDMQTIRAFREAEAHPGPSLILAYATCIAHGIDMARSMTHQKDAVRSGYWPLYRYTPTPDEHARPFRLDSRAPSLPVAEFVEEEGRYAMLRRTDPARAEHLLEVAQSDIDERWHYYEQLAGVERRQHDEDTPSGGNEP